MLTIGSRKEVILGAEPSTSDDATHCRDGSSALPIQLLRKDTTRPDHGYSLVVSDDKHGRSVVACSRDKGAPSALTISCMSATTARE